MGLRVNWRKDAPLIVMGAVALFLAFGMNNPVSHFLIAFPPFSLFRYQGRLAVGVVLALIGLATQVLSEAQDRSSETRNGSVVEAFLKEVEVIERILGMRFHFRAWNEADEKGPMDLRIPLLWSLGIVLVVLLAFLITAVHSKAIVWGGLVLVVDTLITWWAIVAIQKRSGHRFPAWLAVYLIFHLALVYPVGRLATMYVRDFEEAMSFFDRLERSDGLPPRIIVVDVGRLADRDLLSFNLLTPQHHLPNLCAGNTPVFAGVQTLDPYTPLRPIAWHRIVRDEVDAGFREVGEDGMLDAGTAELLQLLGVDAVVTSGDVREIPGYRLSSLDLQLAFGPDVRMFLTETEQPRVWTEDPTKPGKTSAGHLVLFNNRARAWILTACSTAVMEVSYDPNWMAAADDAPTEIEAYKGLFCLVKGATTESTPLAVELTYRPYSFIIGRAISVWSLLLALGWIVANYPRKRRSFPLS
jgi:hypothetical protein